MRDGGSVLEVRFDLEIRLLLMADIIFLECGVHIYFIVEMLKKKIQKNNKSILPL
jgi:hypothetical protein